MPAPAKAAPAPLLPAADHTVTASRGAKINVDPTQARVFLDGRYIGISDDWDGHGGGALLLFASDGRHRLRFTYPGRRDLLVDLVVAKDARKEVEDVEWKLEKGTPGGSTGPDGKLGHPSYRTSGSLRFEVRPDDAQVMVDGKSIGPASRFAREPYRIATLGVHDVALSAPGRRTKTLRVLVSPQEESVAVIDEKLRSE
jgi:hypothetical protein